MLNITLHAYLKLNSVLKHFMKLRVLLVLIRKLLEQALSFHMHFWILAVHQWHVEKVPLQGIAQLQIQTLPLNST